SPTSVYVLGKKSGTTSLTLYDRTNHLIAVVDIVVGPDVTSLKRQLSELMPSGAVGARMSNDSIVLEGTVPDSVSADRAMQIAETFKAAGGNSNVTLGALERKGVATTLAEPTLIALSGETASFLAGGEFPVPVGQNVGGSGGTGNNSAAFTVQWKPFGVSLAF